MRTISSIRTAALVVALVVTACSQGAEPRPPSQDRTTMTAFGTDADAVHAGADLEGRQS